MQTITRIVKSSDQFSASHHQLISQQLRDQQSIIGGIITLSIYGLSMAFLAYNIMLWSTGQNIPKIVTKSVMQESFNYYFEDVVLQFQADPVSYEDNSLDPLNPQELILQPIVEQYLDGREPEYVKYDIQLQPDNWYGIILKNLTLQYNQRLGDPNNPNIGQMFSIGKCDNSSLPDGQQCASEEKINKFFSQDLKYFKFFIIIKQYNTVTQKLEEIRNELVFILDKEASYFSQVILKLQRSEVDDGFLIANNQQLTYLSEYTYVQQQVSTKELYAMYDKPSYLFFYLTLSPTIVQQSIQYQKINEILANTGSIISIIFYLSYIAILINRFKLDQNIIQKVIQIYYPEFEKIEINFNILGRIKEVKQNNKLLDTEQFTKYYSKLKQIAQEKITVANMIYEISRLQFIIQQHYPKKTIVNSHQYGITLKQMYLNTNNQINDSSNFKISKIRDEILPVNNQQVQQQVIIYIKYKNLNDIQQQNDDFTRPLQYLIDFQDEDFGILIHNQQLYTQVQLIDNQ